MRTVAEGAHAVLVLDGAGWHGSKALRVPDNITLLPLPPCAPERNPVENVWAYLRANRLANAVFETCEEIVARCCDARNFFANDSDTVRIMVSTTDCLSLPCCGWRAPHRRGAIFRRRSANGRRSVRGSGDAQWLGSGNAFSIAYRLTPTSNMS